MTEPVPTISQLRSAPHQADTSANVEIRERLLSAALEEFAHFGLSGARLERIAANADCAKRMIYYYFGNKEALYLAVLVSAYSGIRSSEEQLDLETMGPYDALHRLAENSFIYHETNVSFIRLVMMENLQGGSMIGALDDGERLRDAALLPLAQVLERGIRAGIFRPGIDAADVHYMISALSAFRQEHARTWSNLLKVDLLSPERRSVHLAMLHSQIDAYVGVKTAAGA